MKGLRKMSNYYLKRISSIEEKVKEFFPPQIITYITLSTGERFYFPPDIEGTKIYIRLVFGLEEVKFQNDEILKKYPGYELKCIDKEFKQNLKDVSELFNKT
jgi:uncharacterized protein (DUF433 family)